MYITSFEDIINLGISKKISKMYFIWNLEKINHNQQIANQLINEFSNKYKFLKNNTLEQELLKISLKTENNQPELESTISNYIKKIKKDLLNDIMKKTLSETNYIEEDT
ncbi:hypothetical protein FEF22_002000 [Texas Phoenix palm phytoplasma]|uniref:Uncharacterized protein n=1 Tax=Texas Phoenix palm phytoplasma TaxID=176709 RepID=A0ABS5BJL1_9MOLU|nr:hypothetical protein [Texas Phoenix palm phytoplasma]MBP3059546.1 hypothetical protein [Texas Phoenix palm phytoplasma]